MNDEARTREALIEELRELRERVSRLEASTSLSRKEEERLQLQGQLLENVQESVVATDLDGHVVYWGRGAETLHGYTAGEAVGKTLTSVLGQAATEETQDRLRRVRETGSWRGQSLHRHRDGTEFWTETVISLVRDGHGKPWGMVGIDLDITDRIRTEQNMIRLERLRALGEMAQGVAHNFNNLLVGVLGYAQIIQMKTADTDISQDAEHIVRNSLRAKDLVERLNLAVQGESDGTIHPVSVNDAVEKAVEAARPRWKDEPEAEGIAIRVTKDLGDVSQVRGTPTGLYDIVINLLFNAVDALPEGGEIRIRTANAKNGVTLSVSDDGVGMGEETRRRVFEPFFTTKANVGTGLGLSTVHTILTRWGGGVDVESAPDRGTTFMIHLPAWEGPVTDPDEEVQQAKGRRGRVLVVEDEEVVCQVLSDLLSDDYDVRLIMSGREAVEAFVPGQWDVALIDLGMPEMPGDRVAEALRAADPVVATVLITGWELESDDPRVSVFDFRLQKPFAPVEQVAGTVRQAMRLHDDRAQRQSQSVSGGEVG